MIAEALMCMALNIYHEARNQSMVGQVAVAEVVMNRVEDSRFPDTICEVVKQAITYKNTDKEAYTFTYPADTLGGGVVQETRIRHRFDTRLLYTYDAHTHTFTYPANTLGGGVVQERRIRHQSQYPSPTPPP